MTDWHDFKANLEQEQKALTEPKAEWPARLKYPVFAAAPTAKPKPLIKNLLDCGSRILFGGGSKTFKTWLQCDLAICLSCGAPWLGFECVPSRVLYVNLELREYYIQRRFESIREAKGIDCALDNLTVLNLRGHAFDRTGFCKYLLEIIEADKTQIIFIDPFYKLLNELDNENDQTSMGSVLRSFDPINKKDITTSFGIHFSKGNQAGKEPEDRISGAGSIVRDADDIVTLTKHETNHAFTLDFIIRDHPPVDPFVVQWEAPIMVRTDLDPAKIKQIKPRNGNGKQSGPENLLKFIPPDGELQASVISRAKRELHKGTSVITGWISELCSSGKIFRTELKPPGHKGRPVVRLIPKV